VDDTIQVSARKLTLTVQVRAADDKDRLKEDRFREVGSKCRE
jgi:hypothetical protein